MGVTHMARNPRILRRSSIPRLLVIGAALLAAPALRAQESAVRLDPVQAKIEFVLEGNMHTVHGKFALKNSDIRFDPGSGKISGAIVVDATSGDSGNNGRDKKMHHEILESDKFPEIVFTPTTVTGKLTPGAARRITISGQFRLHGQNHEITIPVDLKTDGQNLQIAAHIDVPYVQWGLKNPSNFLLRVGDHVGIDIHAAGHLENAAESR